ncbi:MAG: hypothetical protein ACREFU_03280, partial [Acetobacteraceae bacterium]
MTDDPTPAGSRGGASRRDVLRAGVATGAAIGALTLPRSAAAATPKRGGRLRIQHDKVINLNPGIQSGIATMIPGAQLFA